MLEVKIRNHLGIYFIFIISLPKFIFEILPNQNKRLLFYLFKYIKIVYKKKNFMEEKQLLLIDFEKVFKFMHAKI